jgi:uncharacterized protein (TIGR02231 family)
MGLITSLQSFAQISKKDTIYTNASLEKATVYYGYGADLAHTCKANLTAGMQEVIISNVSLYPDINTLQVACPENVTILSYKHRIFYSTPEVKPDPYVNRAGDTIKILQKQIGAFNNEIFINEDIINRTAELIKNNFTTPDKQNIKSEELIKLSTFYTDKISSIKQKIFDTRIKIDDLNEKIAAIQQRIYEANQKSYALAKTETIGQVILQVMTKTAASVDFDFNYFTRNAGWTPSYDIRVKSIDNSLKLVYKAMVTQTTGLNWNNVKLNLSTSNPNLGSVIPVLSPLYVQLYAPAIYNTWNSNAVSLNEVVVTGYAASSPDIIEEAKDENDNSKYLLRKKPLNVNASVNNMNVSDVANYTSLKESQLNTNFEIDLPYSIPTDGLAYSVNIKEEKITADYQHISIPKMDKDAFLMARINRWDSLSLLPGNANVIMDNVYIGKSFLNPNTTEDTLNLSLGRDKRISIARELKKEFKSVKRGDTKTEIFTYEINMKNNKKQAVEIDLKDQYPISRVKEVEVTLTDNGSAEADAETGMLDWKVKLQPGESKKIRFTYQIKYPKDKMIQEVH